MKEITPTNFIAQHIFTLLHKFVDSVLNILLKDDNNFAYIRCYRSDSDMVKKY